MQSGMFYSFGWKYFRILLHNFINLFVINHKKKFKQSNLLYNNNSNNHLLYIKKVTIKCIITSICRAYFGRICKIALALFFAL